MMSRTKTAIQNFPSFLIETTRLSASLEALNSSLALAAGELWPNILLTEIGQMRASKIYI